MSKRQSRHELQAAGHRITDLSTETRVEATGIDEINGDSEADKLRRMSGLVDANENTIQGKQVIINAESSPEEKEKAKEYRRAVAEAFAGLLPPNFFAALFIAPLRSSSANATSFKDAAEKVAEPDKETTIEFDKEMVSDEVNAILAEDIEFMEDYIAEYHAETDPAKKAQMARELEDLAKHYYKMRIDLENEEGKHILGFDEQRIQLMKNEHIRQYGETPCPHEICVFREVPHAHGSSRGQKVKLFGRDPNDTNDVTGDEVKAAPAAVAPLAPALHLH